MYAIDNIYHTGNLYMDVLAANIIDGGWPFDLTMYIHVLLPLSHAFTWYSILFIAADRWDFNGIVVKR